MTDFADLALLTPKVAKIHQQRRLLISQGNQETTASDHCVMSCKPSHKYELLVMFLEIRPNLSDAQYPMENFFFRFIMALANDEDFNYEIGTMPPNELIVKIFNLVRGCGVSLEFKNSDGRKLVHWACDFGQLFRLKLVHGFSTKT